MRRPRNRNAHRRPAVAAVELAVILLVLGVIVVGMLEMGRALSVRATLSDAARRGCRAAILPSGTNTTISAQVDKVLKDHNIAPRDATIKVKVNDVVADASTARQNDKISVAVSISVSKICWISPHFFSGSSIESETTVMMRQP
jgi:Flp pilus assembly protein TadG